MSWVSIDDRFDDNDDVTAKKPATICLFVCCLTCSARHETDGFITTERMKKLHGFSPSAVNELLEGNKPFLLKVDGGYQIRSYLKFNPSRKERESQREAAKLRKQNSRDKLKASQRDTTRDGRESHNDAGRVTDTPPTRVSPSLSLSLSNIPIPSVDDLTVFMARAKRRNPEADGLACWQFYDASGWRTAKGEPIGNWRTYAGFWIEKNPEAPAPRHLTEEDLELIHR
jgi:hypothetical protein